MLDYLNPLISENNITNIINSASSDFLDLNNPKIKRLDGENKLSHVYIIENKYLIKIVTRRHVEYHRLLTLFWNTSLLYSKCRNLFCSFENPYDMVKYQYNMSRKIINSNILTPKPIDYGIYNGCGIIIYEYIDNSYTLNDIKGKSNTKNIMNEVFKLIFKLHQKNIPHGDLQQDNILISNDDVYIIDVNNINKNNMNYKYYDIASLLSTSSSIIGPEQSIQLAQKYFSKEDIIKSNKFIDIITLQFGYEPNGYEIKTEINNLQREL